MSDFLADSSYLSSEAVDVLFLTFFSLHLFDAKSSEEFNDVGAKRYNSCSPRLVFGFRPICSGGILVRIHLRLWLLSRWKSCLYFCQVLSTLGFRVVMSSSYCSFRIA